MDVTAAMGKTLSLAGWETGSKLSEGWPGVGVGGTDGPWGDRYGMYGIAGCAFGCSSFVRLSTPLVELGSYFFCFWRAASVSA